MAALLTDTSGTDADVMANSSPNHGQWTMDNGQWTMLKDKSHGLTDWTDWSCCSPLSLAAMSGLGTACSWNPIPSKDTI